MAQNSNIILGAVSNSGDNATIRIGTEGTQTKAYIAGIYGQSTSSGSPVVVDTNGKLAVGTLPSVNGANSFCYYLASNVPNVVGNGVAVYFLGQTTALTSLYDNSGGAFHASGGSSGQAYFQAPADGYYFFNYTLTPLYGTSVTYYFNEIFINSPTQGAIATLSNADNGQVFFPYLGSVPMSLILHLTSGQQVDFGFDTQRTDGSNTDGVAGSSSPLVTYVSGFRVQ